LTLCSRCVFSAKRSTMTSLKLLCGLLGVVMMSQLVMSDDDSESIK